MALRPPPAEKPPLGVMWMALALVLAAFLGAALGLVWQSTGMGDEAAEPAAPVDVQPGDSAAG